MTVPTTNDHAQLPHPTKIRKCSVFNENWYVDQTRCEENENKGLDNRQALERPHPRPTPPKLKNVRFSSKIGTETIFDAASPNMVVPTTDQPCFHLKCVFQSDQVSLATSYEALQMEYSR